MNPTHAQALALELMRTHLGGEGRWTFRWTRAKREFGHCDYTFRTIALSKPLTELNDEPQVRDVILHEIAHAMAGPDHGHDAVWKAVARDLGAQPTRCYNGDTVATPPKPWMGYCPTVGCTTIVERHRLTRVAREQMLCRAHREHIVWQRRR